MESGGYLPSSILTVTEQSKKDDLLMPKAGYSAILDSFGFKSSDDVWRQYRSNNIHREHQRHEK
jgi:hypothetical protein